MVTAYFSQFDHQVHIGASFPCNFSWHLTPPAKLVNEFWQNPVVQRQVLFLLLLMSSLEIRQKDYTLVDLYHRSHSAERFGPTFSPSPPSFGPWNLSACSNLAKVVILYCHLTSGSPVPGHRQHVAGWEPGSQQCHSVPGVNPQGEHRCSLGRTAEYFGFG